MLENYSVTWGGAGDILVPVDEVRDVHPSFWPLIELFDADSWARYVITLRGKQLADPAAFEKWLDETAETYAAQSDVPIEAARTMWSQDHLMSDALSETEPPKQFMAELLARTAPAVEHGRLRWDSYRADAGPGGHATDVTNLRPLPPRIRVLDLGHLPLDLQLIIQSRCGGLAPSHRTRLTDAGVSVESVAIGESDVESVLHLAWSGRLPSYKSVPVRQGLGYDDDNFLAETPFGLSTVGCERATRRYAREGTLPPVVVTGGHVDDFAFAFALDRCGVDAYWLPDHYADDNDETSTAVLNTLARVLRESRGRGLRPNRTISVCSLSLEDDRVQSVSAALQAVPWGHGLELEVVERPELPPFRLPSILEASLFQEAMEEPFDGDRMARGVPTAMPGQVTSADPWKINWWTEVSDPSHVLPPRAHLNEEVLADKDKWKTITRCGRDGVAFFSHSMGLVWGGASLRQAIARPRLRFPTGPEIFGRLFAAAGYDVRESTQGRYRRLSIELWGGFDLFQADLANENRWDLLRAWRDGELAGEPIGITTRAGRRFLPFDVASKAAGMSAEETRAALDHYLGRGIVRRGFVLKCGHCLHTDWYDMEGLAQSFNCRRCRTSTVITKGSWLDGDEPQIHYDLAEVVYQALLGNCQVPVHALARLRNQSHSFLECSELDLIRPGESPTEIDLLAVIDGRVIVGEAKSTDVLAKTAKDERRFLLRLRQAAESIRADSVVFATSTATWQERTREQMQTEFARSSCEVQVIENCRAPQP